VDPPPVGGIRMTEIQGWVVIIELAVLVVIAVAARVR
jgi:hypothetical protein